MQNANKNDTRTIFLEPDENGRTAIPTSSSKTRPFKYIWPDGRIEYEPLALFDCLYKLGESGVEKFLPPRESYGWNDEALNAMAWAHSWSDLMTAVAPFSSRYGHLPFWFPDCDLKGRRLLPTAQVDRFLFLLEQVIELPDSHAKIAPEYLITGLIELREAFEGVVFDDWDTDNEWPFLEEK